MTSLPEPACRLFRDGTEFDRHLDSLEPVLSKPAATGLSQRIGQHRQAGTPISRELNRETARTDTNQPSRPLHTGSHKDDKRCGLFIDYQR